MAACPMAVSSIVRAALRPDGARYPNSFSMNEGLKMKVITPQNYRKSISLALLISLAACGGDAEPSAEDMVNDAGDAASANQAAYDNASADMREAAKVKGDLACGLPKMPDARAEQPAGTNGRSYNSDANPEQVAGFYGLAAEAQGGSAEVSGPPGMADVTITMTDGQKCRALAQAQLSGDTNVTVSSENR